METDDLTKARTQGKINDMMLRLQLLGAYRSLNLKTSLTLLQYGRLARLSKAA